MLTLLLKSTGWLLAHTPESALQVLSRILGDLIYLLSSKRRRLVLSNLHHAFPEFDRQSLKKIGRTSCHRLVETGLLSVASPYLSVARIQEIAHLTPRAAEIFAEQARNPKPTILATLHLAYWETLTWLQALSKHPLRPIGAIFRPLDNPGLDRFIRETRARFGMKLLSRKEGFAEAIRMLRAKESVGILFDQNAGLQGALTTLLGRVCSTTELPGILAEKFSADVFVIYPRRLAFWRVALDLEPVTYDGTSAHLTVQLNRWCEDALRNDPVLRQSWLWSHNRWRNQDMPELRLRLEAKRNFLDVETSIRGWHQLPRKTRIFVRLPNWLGDVVMALPLLRAIRHSRPDAELTLIGKAAFQDLVRAADVADHYFPLPPRGFGYWRSFYSLRKRYPDLYLLFTNSARGDLEAKLSGCRQRFGIQRPGKRRFGLSHVYVPPPGFDEKHHHQIELWEGFLRHFGLQTPPDLQPLSRDLEFGTDPTPRIGLIAGSENMPAKRWPIASWCQLIDAFPDCHFLLFGTPGDRFITDQIVSGVKEFHGENLAGKTSLAEFIARLKSCHLLVCNDTGGMHLGNAWGVPVIGLFGPTNPVRTGPVFAAPVDLLQPPGCPPTGGASLSDLPVDRVIAQIRNRLASAALRN